MKEVIITDMANEIKNKLLKGKLLGEDIDLNNYDQSIVAAYEMGKNERLQENIKSMEMLRLLRGAKR